MPSKAVPVARGRGGAALAAWCPALVLAAPQSPVQAAAALASPSLGFGVRGSPVERGEDVARAASVKSLGARWLPLLPRCLLPAHLRYFELSAGDAQATGYFGRRACLEGAGGREQGGGRGALPRSGWEMSDDGAGAFSLLLFCPSQGEEKPPIPPDQGLEARTP